MLASTLGRVRRLRVRRLRLGLHVGLHVLRVSLGVSRLGRLGVRSLLGVIATAARDGDGVRTVWPRRTVHKDSPFSLLRTGS